MPQYEQLSLFFPQIATLEAAGYSVPEPETLGRPLIESALPARTISVEGTAERYSHGKTPHSMHVWWARRPLSSMRAIVFASVARISEKRRLSELVELCDALARFEPYPASAVAATRALVERATTALDLFGGGGSIALEAARLGCKAISIELNPLAIFVQRTLLEYSQEVDELAEPVRFYGLRLLNRLRAETRTLYPPGEAQREAMAYFWTRGVPCPNEECKATLPVKPVIPLELRNGDHVYAWLAPVSPARTFVPRILSGDNSSGPSTGQLMACPFCDERIAGRLPAASNGNFTFIPVACCLGTSDGKLYVPYSGDALPFESYIVRELSAIGAEIPETELPRWSGIVNPTVYGIVRHSDLFSPRQLVVLLMLIRSLRDLYAEILRERGLAVARAVIACLSGFIDQLVDWNSAFSVWLPTNAQVGRSLAGPGLPMQWAFVEIDPFSRGPANLWDKLERIVQACEAIPRFRQRPTVIAGSATQLDLPTASIDAIVTDPPYADNLYYSVLADCIYVWKRLCLRDIFPAEFSQASSPTEPELVASTRRHGGSAAAMAFYRDGLRASLAEGYRVLKPGGVLSLIFTHSTLDGWTALFSAILAAGFRVVTCWPFTIERKARPRGLAKGAVHASCVIVAIKAEGEATAETSTEPGIALSALRTSLKQDGWSQAEIGLALFVKRVGWQLGRASTLSYEQISAVVAECYRQTHEATPDFSLKTRNML